MPPWFVKHCAEYVTTSFMEESILTTRQKSEMPNFFVMG